ncbi:unnamed protein product [Notodromas monacha]|uniref:SAM domain-containing protein n=1 Tax=Notodromas monacha TaxID=399045 RepID=A0A7R9BTB4_9CRUS|nr:unnamed protein product [Notodromas monacha]CAG0920300.1 unnamed protein product [Notodromas monacha]
MPEESQLNRSRSRTARPKPLYQWDNADVVKWLNKKINVENRQAYKDAFEKHDITGKALTHMTEITLMRLGIANPDDAQAIWREILKLRLKTGILEMKEFQLRDKRIANTKLTTSTNS